MRLSVYYLFVFCIISTGCDKNKSVNTSDTDEGRYKVPQAAADGWETAHLKDAGMDQAVIEAMMNLPKTDQHSILIVAETRDYSNTRNYDSFHYNTLKIFC